MKTFELFTKEECEIILDVILNNYKSSYINRQFETDSSSYYKIEITEKTWYYNKIKNWFSNELGLGEVDAYLTLFFYKEGDRFPIHVDKMKYTEFYYDALYNVNVMLNEDYEGGEFILDGIEYKQPAGMIYYYESTRPHGVKVVKSGLRYTLIYFVRERDFKKEKTIL